jgi:hypothetical protein
MLIYVRPMIAEAHINIYEAPDINVCEAMIAEAHINICEAYDS